MRYAKIREMDISNGTGVGVSIFVQGCDFHCKNCFNPETWDFTRGKIWDMKTEKEFIKLIDKQYIKRVSILGGEPMHPKNVFGVYSLITRIRNIFGDKKKIWVYTGYKFEDLYIDQYINDGENYYKFSYQNEVLYKIDVLVDGQFIKEKKDLALPFRGSSNQRIIDVRKSLEENKVFEWSV